MVCTSGNGVWFSTQKNSLFKWKINLDRRSPRQVGTQRQTSFRPPSFLVTVYLPLRKKQNIEALVHHPLNNGKMVQRNILSKLANLRKMRKPTRDKNIFFFFSSQIWYRTYRTYHATVQCTVSYPYKNLYFLFINLNLS